MVAPCLIQRPTKPSVALLATATQSERKVCDFRYIRLLVAPMVTGDSCTCTVRYPSAGTLRLSPHTDIYLQHGTFWAWADFGEEATGPGAGPGGGGPAGGGGRRAGDGGLA